MVACAACGRGSLETARFCGWCGASRTTQAVVVEPHGERKHATVLFADIVDSTELIAGLDVETAVGRLQPVVAAMVQAVQRFGGTVLQTLGDGLKAAFGAPQAREAHALLACRAALAMQEAVAGLPNPTTIRIGLHSGEVVTGRLDTGLAVEEEAQGMTVHVASRMEQAAEPGGICLSPQCGALVSSYCDIESVGVRTLKGVPGTVEVFRLIGLKPMKGSVQFRDRRLSRLRGRESELVFLQRALQDARGGMASVIGIAGSAGVGKSRLCYEFGEWCRAQQIDVLEARAHIFDRATPLLPMLEMMRAHFRIDTGMEPQAARGQVEEKLSALDPSFAADTPYLADFLGLPAPELEGERVDARARHMRLLDIVRRVLKSTGRVVSVIIFEDLHWLDEPSHDFLRAMVEAVDGTRVVMVLNYRAPWSAPFADLAHVRELLLNQLDKANMDDLVGEMVGPAPGLRNLVSQVADRSGGNPFFAEEIVRSLAESGLLAGERGAYRLISSGWRDQGLPATVEAVICTRLDRLTERDKTALQICAVIGKEYPVALVEQAAGLSSAEAEDLFGRLSAMELMQACSTIHGPSFAFRHPLIQEVAYSMMLRPYRARLHAAVADAIMGLPWGQLDEAAAMLAHHYEAAGQPVEAAVQLRRAALWVGRTNPAQALANWRKIRELLLDQPRNEASDQLRALASGRVLGYAWSAGLSSEDVKPFAEEALRFAGEAGDHTHSALLLASYGRVFATSGAYDDFVRVSGEGAALARTTGNLDVVAASTGILSQAYMLAGLLRQALEVNDAAMAAAAEEQYRSSAGIVFGLSASRIFGYDTAQWRLCIRARILVMLGRIEEAESTLSRALQIDPVSITFVVQHNAHAAAIDLAWHAGDAARAARHAAEVVGYADQSGSDYLRVMALGCSGLASSAAGDAEGAAELFRQALTLGRQTRMGLEYEAKLVAHLAESLAHAGDFGRAWIVASEAIEVARRRTDRVAELHASMVAALAACRCDDRRLRWQAGSQLRRAHELLDITGAAIFEPMLRRTAELTCVGSFDVLTV
jgi:class 3 adenylate cyclase/tetratricopeptide (TPR) repeat protein